MKCTIKNVETVAGHTRLQFVFKSTQTLNYEEFPIALRAVQHVLDASSFPHNLYHPLASLVYTVDMNLSKICRTNCETKLNWYKCVFYGFNTRSSHGKIQLL